jgi:4-amino-4-deoxy-L-arabinose transferase-like glycosyltransferase
VSAATESAAAEQRRIGSWCDAGAVLLIAMVGLFVGLTIPIVWYRLGVDEGFYLRYMRAISEGGVGAFPDLFRFYLSDEEIWNFPPPTRVGFIALSALFAWGLGPTPYTLSYLSLTSHLALIAVQYFFARRNVGPRCALAIAALTACAPILLGLARRALTDPTICLTQVSAMWLFLEMVKKPEPALPKVLFGASFLAALLVKEIALLLALPLAAFAAIERFHRRTPLPIGSTLATLAIPPVLTVAVWVAAAQDSATAWRVVRIVMASPATNPFAIQFGAGPWYRYLVDEIAASPWPTLLGLAGVALAVWRWRSGDYDRVAVFFALVYVLQIAALSPFTKNLRYALPIESPLRLLAVLGMWTLFDGERKRVARLAIAAVVAALCAADWSTYRTWSIERRMYDPLTVTMLQYRGMLPPSTGR